MRWLPALGVIALVACSSSDGASGPGGSPCVAFERPPDPALRLAPIPSVKADRAIAGKDRTFYVQGTRIGAFDTGAPILDAAMAADGRAFVARRVAVAADLAKIELVRYSPQGDSFDPASAKVILTVDSAPSDATVSLAFAPSGLLFVATSDFAAGFSSAAQDPGRLAGKVLRIDVTGDTYSSPRGNPFEGGGGKPEIFALGVHRPTIDVDPVTEEVWLVDRGVDVDELDRVYAGKNFGWPTRQGPRCVPPAGTCPLAGADDGVLELDGAKVPRLPDDARFAVSRSAAAEGVAAAIVYRAATGIVAIDPFGPSGPPGVNVRSLAADASMRVIGRGSDGAVVLSNGNDAAALVDDAKSTAPRLLSQTKCFDEAGPVKGGIAYDVAVPLWSDGATKDRVAVVPAGKSVTVRPDGDFLFPVGTVMVKTFTVDGRRVETRLLVQHALEDWVGYSYAWNKEGTDAELVVGSRRADLGGGKTWTFPSRADCMACHTPAAGYALGPEARQIASDAFSSVLAAPLERDKYAPLLTPLDGPGSDEAKARSYLHANCSVCHRDGSATGLAELDLRVDVPLAKTGVCGPPKTTDLGVRDASVVAAGAPERSTLLLRMKRTDDLRMPKLASHVVDARGAAVVEVWIKGLKACN